MTKPAIPPFHPLSNRTPAQMARDEFETAFPAESDYIERKSGTGQDALARAVTALSNTEGGVILIGVRDDGEIVGRALTDGVENAIHQAALTVHDPGRYRIREIDVEGRPVTVVSVAKRSQGFAQTADGQILVRRGARSTPLLGAELLSFVTSRALERFEENDSGVAVGEADPELTDEVRRAFRWRTASPDRFIQHKLARANGDAHLTVAGALLLLHEPRDRLGKAFVEVLRFPDEGVNYDRRIEFVGPVHRQVEEVTAFLMDELGTDLIVSGARRYELPRIPEVVLREAVANAVAHRSYEELGRAIRIELRSDRVTIISPGGLPEPVTEENIRETQSARNIRVLSALRQLRLAEDAGRGVDVMQDSMAEALLDPPVFEDLGHSMSVTLPIRGPISPQERAWVMEVERHAATCSPWIGSLSFTPPAARLSRTLACESFLALIAAMRGKVFEGFATLDSSNSLASAEVRSTRLRAPFGHRLSSECRPPDLKQCVMELAAEERLTNAKVRAATGLDRVETFRLLR